MHALRSLLALLLLALASAATAQGFVPVPPLTFAVTDNIGMLTPDQRQALEDRLRDYEARTGSQIALLLISKTEPEAIEQYSIRVAEAWKIGRKGIDDGAILVVAKDNPPALRRLRIEAGRGVQGVLTDAQSKRILQDVIAPYFRKNDFYGGLAAGVSAITGLLDQEKFPAPARANPGTAGPQADLGSMLPFLFFIIVLVLTMSRVRGTRRGLSSNGWGRSTGVILGSGMGGLGGFGGGGFGGGGGFSGGGGFGGGGGTFDGGGASGDW